MLLRYISTHVSSLNGLQCFFRLYLMRLMTLNRFCGQIFKIKSECLPLFYSTTPCLFVLKTDGSHTLNNALPYMLVNGNCQLCQSKSNCPSPNLALLNLYLMFSARLGDLLSDYIIPKPFFCFYTSCSVQEGRK